jgi:NitT/TauT family transport system permease protein
VSDEAAVPRAPNYDSAGADARRRTTAYDWQGLSARLFAVATVLAVWQWIPTSLVPEFAISRPVDTFRSLWDMAWDGTLGPNVVASLKGLAMGLIFGAPLGVAIAVLLRIRGIGWLLEPLVTLCNAIPKVALISFFVLWLGISETSHLALVLSFVIFIFCYNMRQAMDEVDPNRLTSFRLFGADQLQLARLLIFPSSIPYLLAAVRIAVPLAFSAQVFAELRIPTTYGLGSLLGTSAQALDGAGAMAVMIVVAMFGYLFDIVIGKRLSAYARRIGTVGDLR